MKHIRTVVVALLVLAAVGTLGNQTTAALPPTPAALNPYAATDDGFEAFHGVWTDGAGTWLAGYNHSSDPLGPVLQRSTDGGATWTSPASVPIVKELASDGAGTWLAVDIPLMTPPALSDVTVARSTDNGLTWSSPAVLATGASASWEPRVATDGLATWVVVWTAPDAGPGDDIFLSRSINDGLTWSPPMMISLPGLGHDASPQVATDGQGMWLVVWEYTDAYDSSNTMRVRSTNNGATWSSPAVIAGSAYASPDDLAADAAGHWMVAWDGYVLGSADGAVTWNQIPVTPGADPRLQVGGPGNWLIAWDDNGGPTWVYDQEIFVSRSMDDGATWSVAVPLNVNAPNDSRHDVEVEIAADNQDHLVAVWGADPLAFPRERDIYYTYCSLAGGGGPPCQLPICTQPIGPWVVPIEDEDCDGFSSTAEGPIGTMPLVACAATTGSNDEDPDAWPSDANDDRDADVGDVVMLFKDVIMNPPTYRARSDMDADDDVDIGDVIAAFGGGKILTSCG